MEERKRPWQEFGVPIGALIAVAGLGTPMFLYSQSSFSRFRDDLSDMRRDVIETKALLSTMQGMLARWQEDHDLLITLKRDVEALTRQREPR